MAEFYAGLIGLNHVDEQSNECSMVFRGYPRSGPELILNLTAKPPPHLLGRRVLIQIASLFDFADRLSERGTPFVRSQGWGLYDRRLSALDLAANRVELVTYHAF